MLVHCLPMCLQQSQAALDEQTGGPTAGVVHSHAGLWIEDTSHKASDLRRGVEGPSALLLSFGELSDQVLISSREKFGLHVLHTKPALSKRPHKGQQSVVVDDPLSVCDGIEVDRVDDSLEPWVLVGDGTHSISERLAEPGCL